MLTNPAIPQQVARSAATSTAASEGFLLLNSSMNLILFNRAAAEILSYPHKPETHQNLDQFLASKVNSMLVSRLSCGPALVSKFRSGRRIYRCRSYRVNSSANGDSQASVAVVLERGSRGAGSLVDLSERFRLTNREQEVVQYLFEGLTTKEIAIRLQISPHTVKAFIRLIMVKMEVSTRSGIVGKALALSA
jgi:DNA-binding CsgD family transcriptional regulator